ncbi:MAG: DNA-3-methyladenine glycosylase 2 family protein [Planctomycetes bacterium]|nr:DNA-3-methyladenine glycosylase 2 family protein [Planctomycetota bacterium]
MRPPTRSEKHLTDSDPTLAKVIRFVRDNAKGTPELFRRDTRPALEALCSAIVAQQLSSSAARTIFARLRALVSGDFTSEAVLAIPETALRAAGLSGSKTRFVHEIARANSDGRFEAPRLSRLDDAKVREALCAVKGIGPWTAEMYLIFKLRRPDVLPINDGGIQRAIHLAYGGKRPTPAAVTRRAEPWRPHATTACLFLWSALDLGFGRKPRTPTK